jgi:hypothetical protein
MAANKEVQKMIAEDSDFNGCNIAYMFDEAFTPSLMQHLCIQWEERLDKMTNDVDEDYLGDLPELERRDGASDSDSSASDNADVSIYGELTPGSANRILRIIQADQGSQGSQGSQDEDTTIATPVSILDVGLGTMRVPIQAAFEMGWDAAGFDNSANRVFLGASLCKMANLAANKLVSDVLLGAANASDNNGFDVELLRRDGASDSDSSASDK